MQIDETKNKKRHILLQILLEDRVAHLLEDRGLFLR